MSSDIITVKRFLTRLLAVYVVGTFLFFLFALASVCFGYYLLAYRREHDLPLSLILYPLPVFYSYGRWVRRFGSKLPCRRISER